MPEYFTHHLQQKTVPKCCEWEGCEQKGEYPAPKSSEEGRAYYWFCLEHVREFNRSWDYFSHSGTRADAFYEEIEHGHRPTWTMGVHAASRAEKILEAAMDLMGAKRTKRPEPEPETVRLPQEVKEALGVFNLQWPVDKLTVKKRYKMLVKQYHPDVHGNSPEAEERFKGITVAYGVLIEVV